MRERYSFEETDGSGRLFVMLAVVAFAFLAGWHLSKGNAPAAAPEPVAVVAPDADPSGAVLAPLPVGSPAKIPRPRMDSRRQRYVDVYECTENGRRTVSDRPCGPGATSRVLVVDPPKAPPLPVPTWRSSTPARSTSARSGSSGVGARANGGNEAACAAVGEAIDRLNARMRQPYSSQEGERLRERWHELKERRYDLGCGR
jgi:hypothetical protein